MNKKDLGYSDPLYILAFDHRSSFFKMFGYSEPLTPDQVEQIKHAKWLIYEGFKKAVAENLPPASHAGVLVDEQFGSAIHEDAPRAQVVTALTQEKSGQDEFDFEYSDDFGKHIQNFSPTFAKALIRYNPDGDRELNARQRTRLKILSDFCHDNGYKFLIEPLIPATQEQLESVGGDETRYDNEIRYKLMVQMIKELQDDGVDPDIWKIEGLESAEQYDEVLRQARIGGRENVKAVVLGRGADDAQVEKWLRAGAGSSGVIGFAIGRSIFKHALTAFNSKEMKKEQAVEEIARKYSHFYKVFTESIKIRNY